MWTPRLTLPSAISTLAGWLGHLAWMIRGERIAGPDAWWRVLALLSWPELVALGRALGESPLALALAGGRAPLQALRDEPPPPRRPGRRARLAAWRRELVVFSPGDPGRVDAVLAALDGLPRLVAEAVLRTSYIVLTETDAAWVGGSSFPLTRWPIVLGPTADLAALLRHEWAHVWFDRSPSGPLVEVDPIVLARAAVAPDRPRAPEGIVAWRTEAEVRAEVFTRLWGLPR